MSDDSHELVAHLKKQNADLLTESMKRKDMIRTLRAKVAELEPFRQQVADLTAERDTFKARAESSPGEHAATIADLERQIRTRDVRDRFREAGIELADKVTIDHVFKLNDFDPGKADPAALDVAELVKGWREASPALFKTASETEADAPGGAKRPRLETHQLPAGRGAPDTNGSHFTVRRSDTEDALWMQRNQGALAAAVAAGTVRWKE